MKTVLIVEDEKMIRQGIRVMIQRCPVPVENIIECSNGAAALEMLQQQAVDVMFTDIRMPHMDGIELVNEVQKLQEKPLIVAISGYDDFSYAVEMLRNGVREYILKPVEREKITSILQKLDEELENKKKLAKADQMIGKSQLRHLLLDEEVLAEEMDGLVQKYGDTFFPEGYRIAVGGEAYTVPDGQGLIFLPEIHTQNVCIFDPACTSLQNMDRSVGVSQISHGIAEIKPAYYAALRARKRAYYTMQQQVEAGQQQAHIPEAIRESAKKLLEESAWMQKLHLIGTDKTEELGAQWKTLFTETKREHITPEEFEAGMEYFFTELTAVYHNLLDDRLQQDIDRCRRLYLFSDIGAYETAVMQLVCGIHEKIHAQGDPNGVAKKIRQAQEYIQENYNKDLNMAVVSNYISMNYSVFSCEFKNYTGVNFVTYLKELRMKEAKKLLAETDKKIIEISQMVGYENEKHFMKLFKTICGVSPSEYRKNMRHQE